MRKLLSLLRIVYNLALNLVLLVRHRVGKLGRNGSLKISDRATPNSHGTNYAAKGAKYGPEPDGPSTYCVFGSG